MCVCVNMLMLPYTYVLYSICFPLLPLHGSHSVQLFEIDVLISGYLSFLGPRIEEGHFVKPCAEFLILILGECLCGVCVGACGEAAGE